jgi:hypothetical protein
MATQQQVLANRENAKASTGPQTPAGKTAVSRNAMRHGLTASSIDQFPAHVQDQYLTFRESLLAEFRPGTQHQILLFEQYAFAQFLLVRAQAIHANAIEQALAQPENSDTFTRLMRVQRYLRGLEQSALKSLLLFQHAYADRCAAVDLQDTVTNSFDSPVIVPAAAPVSRILTTNFSRPVIHSAAVRITHVEQARLGRQQNEANPIPNSGSSS